MQSDQKVGLALGVLLIGVVAAFFFRNETATKAKVPGLERAEEVDREISEKRLTPYISTIETDDPPRGTHARSASDSRDDSTGERKLPRWDEIQTDRDDPFAENGPQKPVPAPAPDPIRFEAAATDSATGPKPDHNQAWNPVDDLAAAEPPAAIKIHEVQKGETLSSIAGKYLGSQTRFHDIFEANRDQLRDANDLQVGMKLRIPDPKAKPAAAKSTAQPATGRGKKAERKSASPKVPEPPPAPPDVAPSDVEDVFAQSADEQSSEEMKAVVTEEPPAAPAEPPKVKFTPAKRRPIR